MKNSFIVSSVKDEESKPSNEKKFIKSGLNPNYVSGFLDGESCFHLAIGKNSKYKIGYYVNPGFSIVLHKKDEFLLKEIQKFFGGIGNLKVKSNIVQFRVFSLDELDVILNHLEEYPLITKKSVDYSCFKEAIMLIKNKEHLNIEGFNKIISLRASMNLGLPNVLKEAFPDISKREIISKDIPSELNPYWVAGFVDAEGCFWIKIIKNLAKDKMRPVLGFQVTQHNRDLLLMEKLIEFFNCGRLEKTDSASSLVVTKLSLINEIIVPFFNNYCLSLAQGSKSQDFRDWSKAVELVNKKAHLTTEGLDEILKIKSNMNSSRKLDYNIDDTSKPES